MFLTGFDYVLVVVLAVSMAVGFVRGLIRELLSVLSWVVSIWLAIHYAEGLAVYLGPYLNSPQLQYLVALAGIFVLSLLALSLLAMLLAKLLSMVGIAGTDRSLGVVFGMLRGLAIALAGAFLLRLTPAVQEPWYRDSVLVPYFDPVFEYLDNQDFIAPLERLPAAAGGQ